MIKKLLIFGSLIIFALLMVIYNLNKTEVKTNLNLINKVNIIENSWVNYKGISEKNKGMNQSQFIPYNSTYGYEVSHDTYVSYYNGNDFIKTELNDETPGIINTVENADGIILSFNKENKSGIQLIKIDQP